MKREIVSAHRLIRAKILQDYPELRALSSRKDKALTLMANTKTSADFVAKHKQAKKLCEQMEKEIQKRYQILV